MKQASPQVSIIMYHFVRELNKSRYPEIKGLDYKLFIEQVKYLKKHYTFITMEELIDAYDSNYKLPSNSVLLTFDDAYSDHYTHVFPILDELKIQGSFYVPVKTIEEQKVLDVNKIHFILAAEPDRAKIIQELYKQLEKYRKDYNLETDHYYYTKLAQPARYDPAEVVFIKRMLQVELEESIRKKIVTTLFEKIVKVDEQAFSNELYVNIDQLKCMHRNGMHIGNHGWDHFWLNSLSYEQQKLEIVKGCDFLRNVGVDMNKWTMCYPYGAYNLDTLKIVQEFNCKIGLTTEVNIANITNNNRFALPRLNTNDIPKDRNSKVNDWYNKLATNSELTQPLKKE